MPHCHFYFHRMKMDGYAEGEEETGRGEGNDGSCKETVPQKNSRGTSISHKEVQGTPSKRCSTPVNSHQPAPKNCPVHAAMPVCPQMWHV